MTAPAIAYDLRSAAEQVGVSERTIQRATKATVMVDGIPPLPSRRLGRKVLVSDADLREWFNALPQG